MRETVTDPIGSLQSIGVPGGAEVGKFKEDPCKTKAHTPHAFDKGVLLRGIHHGGPVPDLFSTEEITKVMRLELATLIGSHDMREKFMSKAHVEAKVSKEEFETALRNVFGGGMAREDTHKGRASINGATVASVLMRETRSEGALKVKMHEGAGGWELVRVTGAVERE